MADADTWPTLGIARSHHPAYQFRMNRTHLSIAALFLVLLLCASASNAVMDTLSHRFNESVFTSLPPQRPSNAGTPRFPTKTNGRTGRDRMAKRIFSVPPPWCPSPMPGTSSSGSPSVASLPPSWPHLPRSSASAGRSGSRSSSSVIFAGVLSSSSSSPGYS